MQELRYRIVRYKDRPHEFEVIEMYKTHKEAKKALYQMVKKKQCDIDSMYFIQSLVQSPVRTKEDRERFFEKMKELKENEGVVDTFLD